jgi:hypothetical protein
VVGGGLLLLILNFIPVMASSATPMHSPAYWVGRHKSELFAVWGKPDTEVKTVNGGSKILFDEGQQFTCPTGYDYQTYSYTLSDRVVFYADPNGVVIDFYTAPWVAPPFLAFLIGGAVGILVPFAVLIASL